ncbi:hypothetical protein ACQKO5_21065 [Novosphingobium subterraneum]|uniref:hypothetical protein n=1 Tax=Novosphingobium subterraneum TaxID=48936 RepID=UPI003D09499C
MPAHVIRISWWNSCDPRVKLPAFRFTFPRAEAWVRVAAFLLNRMSSAMMLSHVGERLSDQVFSISRILLLDDERERKLGMLEDCDGALGIQRQSRLQKGNADFQSNADGF